MSNASFYAGTITNQDTTVKDRISSACERNVKENTETVTGGEVDLTKNTVQALDVEDEVRASNLLVQNPTGAYSSKEKPQSMCCLEDFSPSTSIINISDGLSTYVRPRIFCLEHAIQVEELLSGKGGADLLVICHSGENKLLAHASKLLYCMRL